MAKIVKAIKVIKGSCNRCGSCCGYGSYPKCALPYALFKWDKQHPELGLPLIKSIKSIIGEDKVNLSGSIAIPVIGQINFYLSKDGLQTSKTDNTCPFFDKATKECKIWNTQYLRNSCKNVPQNLTDERKIEKWGQDHPNCGFYWEEK